MFIHQTVDRARRLFRDREAVVCGDTRLTYGELDERVARLAEVLVGAGVEPGERVGLLMLNCHRYLESYLAAERAGTVLAPLNHRLAPAELAYILNDAEAAFLILDAALLPLYEACKTELHTVRGVLVADPSPSPPTPPPSPPLRGEGSLGLGTVPKKGSPFPLGPSSGIQGSPQTSNGARGLGLLDYESALAAAEPLEDVVREWQESDLVQLYYTSGTTGRPKGVMLSQRNVMSNAEHMMFAHRFTGRDTWLHAAPMFHLADAWACWTVTWLGGKHVFLREFNPQRLMELVQGERVTVTLIVPTMINAIVNLPDVAAYDAGSLRLISFGASPMPVDRLKAAMQVLPCAFSQMYGMTETAPLATQLLPEDIVTEGDEREVRRLASCGREVPGVRVRVVREDGGDVAPGEVGEIVMQGPNIMLGYWRLPEVSADTLRGGWMHSGDLATVDDEGFIYIVDRKKDMIITGGENVFSTEVEDALYRHPAVLEAAVIGVPDERWGERVHAIVVLRPGQAVDGRELSDFCRRHIAAYKIPRSVDFVAALPKTGSGKIQKAELREPYWQGYERRVN